MLYFKTNIKRKHIKDKAVNENEILLCPVCNQHKDDEENLLNCKHLRVVLRISIPP